MDVHVPELNVQAILFDEDDVVAEKEAELRGPASSCAHIFKGKGKSKGAVGCSAGAPFPSCTSK
jgi:hypothetical protein